MRNYDADRGRTCTAFLGVKYAATKMKSLGVAGSIIITASVASLEAHPGLCAYTMSKFAVRALTITAAKEYAGDKIRVNAVSPGYVRTPMLGDLDKLKSHIEATPAGESTARSLQAPNSHSEAHKTKPMLGLFQGGAVTALNLR